MSKPTHVIVAPAFDECGWDYPQAIIAFYNVDEKAVNRYRSSDEDPHYKLTSDIDEISYTASYWGSQQIKNRKCPSRPMYVLNEGKSEPLYDEDDEPLRAFSVDMDKPQYQQIMQQPGEQLDKLCRIIEKHYREEVAR